MRKITLLTSLLLAFVICVNAQQKKPFISFATLEHDYSKIKEADGKAVYKFEFTNTGSEPLVLTSVQASCGCTTPEWSKEPILANKKGAITVSYDPKNRPGIFNKTITVKSNAENGDVVLRIKGDVVAKEPTIEDKYPKEIGGLRFETDHVAFQNVKNTEVKIDTVQVINTSAENKTLSFKKSPAHISIKVIPETIKPNDKGIIIVTYDGKLVKDWGFLIERLPVEINGLADEKNENRITVSANLEEDFSKLTPAQLENAPKIEFESQVFDFGTITQGDKVDYVFKFKNSGKSELQIRKIKASCGCTVVEPESKVVAPGAESSMKATFNSMGKEGKQNKTVTVITNDPKSPNITLKVTGTVNKK